MIIFQNSCLMPKKLGRMELQWAITGVGQIFESQLYITDPWPTGISDVALSFRRLFALAKYHTLTPCLFFCGEQIQEDNTSRWHIRRCYECTTFMTHNLTVKIHEDSLSHSNAACTCLQPIPVECAGSHPHSRKKCNNELGTECCVGVLGGLGPH